MESVWFGLASSKIFNKKVSRVSKNLKIFNKKVSRVSKNLKKPANACPDLNVTSKRLFSGWPPPLRADLGLFSPHSPLLLMSSIADLNADHLKQRRLLWSTASMGT